MKVPTATWDIFLILHWRELHQKYSRFDIEKTSAGLESTDDSVDSKQVSFSWVCWSEICRNIITPGINIVESKTTKRSDASREAKGNELWFLTQCFDNTNQSSSAIAAQLPLTPGRKKWSVHVHSPQEMLRVKYHSSLILTSNCKSYLQGKLQQGKPVKLSSFCCYLLLCFQESSKQTWPEELYRKPQQPPTHQTPA